MFGDCLHRYLIKDAIADENVLGFLVEYYQENGDVDVMEEKRMREIAQFILNNFNKSTYDGDFNALFAIQSVPMLLRYYKIFKELNPKIRIGAVFTYAANDSQDDEQTGMNQGFANNQVTADELQAIMDDYNGMFHTNFSTDNFSAYYDDINLRMKKKRADMQPLDLLLVVGMFLTGFDAKKLNTLYVDKNLEYHGLLQAFSRTNRVLNEKKRFGKVVCFRNLKDNVDKAVKLFSNTNAPEALGFVLRAPFEDVKRELNALCHTFLKRYPDMAAVDRIQNEYDKRAFILAFRDIIKKRSEIQIYEEFDADDPAWEMTDQQFNDYRSKYLDMTLGLISAEGDDGQQNGTDETPGMAGEDQHGEITDIDFCLELLHSDVINVAYILELIAELNPDSEDYGEKRRHIIDTMIKDPVMRNKTRLIDNFIRENVDSDHEGFTRSKADGTMDLESRLTRYVTEARLRAISDLAKEEGVDELALVKYVQEYDYLQREKPEILQHAIKQKKGLRLLQRSWLLKNLTAKLRNIISTFSWE